METRIKHLATSSAKYLQRANNDLARYKHSTSTYEERLRKVEATTLSHHQQHDESAHKRIWTAEKGRLDSLQSSIESELQKKIIHVMQDFAMKDPKDCIQLIQMVEKSPSGSMNNGIDDVSKIRDALDMVELISNAEFASGETRRALGDKLNAVKLDINNDLSKWIEELHSLQKGISRIQDSQFKSELRGEVMDLDPWIIWEGQVMRFSDVSCEDENLNAQKMKDYHGLIDWYKTALERIQLDLDHTNHRLKGDSITSNKDLILKIKDEYEQCGKAAGLSRLASRNLLQERIARHLGQRSRDSNSLKVFEKWLEHRQALISKRDMIHQMFCRKFTEFTEASLVQFTDANNFYTRIRETNMQLQTTMESMAKKHAILKQWREHRLTELAMAAERRKMEMEAEIENEMLRQQKERNRRAAIQSQIYLYQTAKFESIQRRKGEMERQKKIREQEAKEQAKVNLQRIHYRQDKMKEKEAMIRHKAHEKERAEYERQQSLEKLRNMVRVNAVRDPNRLLWETDAFKAKKEIEEQHQRWPLGPSSFSDDLLMQDTRSRLAAELHRHGLANSEYGIAVLQSLIPKAPPRRDMAVTLSLG